MTTLLHTIDLQYAALPDAQIEAMWRHAIAHDPDAREPLLRQLVLRAAAVIDDTCRREGESRGFNEAEHERAFDESAQRLMSRLRVDAQVRDIRAVAHEIASEVVADPDRRRAPRQTRFAAPPRPSLRLVTSGDPR